MKRVLTLKKFTYLFLATMATKTPVDDDGNILECVLPSDFKQNIQNIMCEQNGWEVEFSGLIDVEKYFYDHFAWEREFSKTIREVLCELKKDYVYHIDEDEIRIPFKKQEVDLILSKFNKPSKEKMDHFVNLVGGYTFTRHHNEHIYDSNARSVKLMQELNHKRYRDDLGYTRFMEDIKRRAYGDKENSK